MFERGYREKRVRYLLRNAFVFLTDDELFEVIEYFNSIPGAEALRDLKLILPREADRKLAMRWRAFAASASSESNVVDMSSPEMLAALYIGSIRVSSDSTLTPAEIAVIKEELASGSGEHGGLADSVPGIAAGAGASIGTYAAVRMLTRGMAAGPWWSKGLALGARFVLPILVGAKTEDAVSDEVRKSTDFLPGGAPPK